MRCEWSTLHAFTMCDRLFLLVLLLLPLQNERTILLGGDPMRGLPCSLLLWTMRNVSRVQRAKEPRVRLVHRSLSLSRTHILSLSLWVLTIVFYFWRLEGQFGKTKSWVDLTSGHWRRHETLKESKSRFWAFGPMCVGKGCAGICTCRMWCCFQLVRDVLYEFVNVLTVRNSALCPSLMWGIVHFVQLFLGFI